MVPFLITNRSFQILKLNNNGLGPAGGTIIANALLESARLSKKEGQPSNLRTVICGRNRLEDGSAPAWAAAFKEHGGLREIHMPQNGIRTDGISKLVLGISECKGLEYLDLQDNTFGELGSKTMAEVLDQWPSLHTLNLADCILAEEGSISPVVETLAKGSNPNVHTLMLQNNNFETETFSIFARNIDSAFMALRLLEIQWNEIEDDDEGIALLRRVLKSRGGRLVVEDEEDDEDEDEEQEAEQKDEDTRAEEQERTKKDEEEQEPQKSVADEASDAIADLLAQVSIGPKSLSAS